MRKFLAILASCGLAAAWTPAFADPSQPYGMDRNSGHQSAGDDLPHCDRPIGVAAVKEPDRDWWSPLGLGNPESVLKMFALRSGCLRMVDRNGGLAMRNQEQGLSSSGELQRGSNLGRGQVLAADFFIVPDIAERQPGLRAAATSARRSATSCRAASARWRAASASTARKPAR